MKTLHCPVKDIDVITSTLGRAPEQMLLVDTDHMLVTSMSCWHRGGNREIWGNIINTIADNPGHDKILIY